MKHGMRVVVSALLIFQVLIGALSPVSQVRAASLNQMTDPGQKAKNLLPQMTPEEKVGQLFMITFKGRSAAADTQIYDLIANWHVGGVMLSEANENFIGPNGTISQAQTLIKALQTVEWDASQTRVQSSDSVLTSPSRYVPLFIGISQEGDQTPYDQLINGVTTLPSEMAIGATWQTSLAREVGAVMGRELSGIGFNLFIGPSLDVLDTTFTETGDDLGTRTFGGDPFWVGEMGKAYISGLHSGSNYQIAVISKHFPGRGSSDRQPGEEVATVRKSLEQLKQIELAPFFAVTGNAPDSASTTDGLLVSHIRYQGFQGNIRATTKPVSFDQTALEQILSLSPFATWRENNGIIVSDDLGSQAVRLFYDPSGTTFDARQVARDAFLAGNDLLFVDNIVSSDDADSYTTITRILEQFARKYREDLAFAQRVDASVLRILTLKFQLYSEFDLDMVLPQTEDLSSIGTYTQAAFDVASRAATLISPSIDDLRSILSRPPTSTERIVFLTDVMSGHQCTLCTEQSVLSVDALQSAVLRLYGPHGGGQVQQTRLSSYSFSDLRQLLDNVETEQTLALTSDLQLADWLVISMRDNAVSRPDSQAFKRLLSEKANLLRNKKVIVFALGAPYYLDATDISKITAYYGLYAKNAAFIEVAARILFQELTPLGASPVSIPGVGYDLIEATSPDPDRVIDLYLDTPDTPAVTITPTIPGATPEATPVPRFQVGDYLPLRTGQILDHNQNVVPDGTVVQFVFTVSGTESSGTQQQIEGVTVDGVARATYRILTPGLLEVRAVSNPAITSRILQLDITAGAAAAITVIAPTAMPTETGTPEPTPSPTVEPTKTPVPVNTARPGGGEWVLALLMIATSGAVAYYWGNRMFSMRWGVRWALTTMVGGWVCYLYMALGLPGTAVWLEAAHEWGVLIFVAVGLAVGVGCGIEWRRQMELRARRDAPSRPFSGSGKPTG